MCHSHDSGPGWKVESGCEREEVRGCFSRSSWESHRSAMCGFRTQRASPPAKRRYVRWPDASGKVSVVVRRFVAESCYWGLGKWMSGAIVEHASEPRIPAIWGRKCDELAAKG